MRTAALYTARTIAIVNSFRRALATNAVAPNGSRRSLRKFALVLVALIGSALLGELNASIKVLGLYGQICVTVYDLREGNERGEIRDDIATRISAKLQVKISELQRLRRIRARPDCIEQGENGFERQFMLALYIKHQTVEIGNKEYNVVIVGGSSPNAAGAFADYDLHPIIIIQQDPVSEKIIEEKLVDYVDRNLVSTLRP